MSGEALEVSPLDNAKLLDEAKPISPDGRFCLDAAKLSARHDGQVQAALKGGPFALVILGGAHDLTQSVRRYVGGPCEYMRVTTREPLLKGESAQVRLLRRAQQRHPGNFWVNFALAGALIHSVPSLGEARAARGEELFQIAPR
jgi:hypothetical protein